MPAPWTGKLPQNAMVSTAPGRFGEETLQIDRIVRDCKPLRRSTVAGHALADADTVGYEGSFRLPLLGGAAADATDIAGAFLPVVVCGMLVLLIAATMPARPVAVMA